MNRTPSMGYGERSQTSLSHLGAKKGGKEKTGAFLLSPSPRYSALRHQSFHPYPQLEACSQFAEICRYTRLSKKTNKQNKQ